MSTPRDPLGPDPDTPRESDPELEQLLISQRPVPGAAFRGGLGRMVAASDPGYGPRPARLRLLVAAWVLGGTAVAAVGALQSLGAL